MRPIRSHPFASIRGERPHLRRRSKRPLSELPSPGRPKHVATLTPNEFTPSACDFTAVINVLETHIACVTATREQSPALVPYAVEAAGRAMLAALAKDERINLAVVATALACPRDVTAIAHAAVRELTRAVGRSTLAHADTLRAALEEHGDELGLWLTGELVVVFGRYRRRPPPGMTQAALLSALDTFAAVHGLGTLAAEADTCEA